MTTTPQTGSDAAPPFETLTVSMDPPSGSEGSPGRVGRLTLNQPHKLNPLGTVPLREVAEAADWFDAQGPSVVIVTGAGDRAFCAGFDLNEFSDPPAGRSGADLGRRMAEALDNMDALTIAAIHGHCVGGGLVLAAACDLRVAAENTTFSIPEIDLGIPLAWAGIPRLVREVGPAMTKELVLTCRPFTAPEALSLGFLNRVVPTAEVHTVADELAAQICTKAPSLVFTTKRQVHVAVEEMASTRDGFSGDAHLTAAMNTPDAKAAAIRYLKSKGR